MPNGNAFITTTHCPQGNTSLMTTRYSHGNTSLMTTRCSQGNTLLTRQHVSHDDTLVSHGQHEYARAYYQRTCIMWSTSTHLNWLHDRHQHDQMPDITHSVSVGSSAVKTHRRSVGSRWAEQPNAHTDVLSGAAGHNIQPNARTDVLFGSRWSHHRQRTHRRLR